MHYEMTLNLLKRSIIKKITDSRQHENMIVYKHLQVSTEIQWGSNNVQSDKQYSPNFQMKENTQVDILWVIPAM